jgi:hypothetical protein
VSVLSVSRDNGLISNFEKPITASPRSQFTEDIAEQLAARAQPRHPSNSLDEADFNNVLESKRFTQFEDGVAQLLIPIYQDDYQWEGTTVGRWATLAKTLPAVITRGSIVVERGRPHFKGPPLAQCPRCKSKLTHGTVTLTFRYAPPASQEQPVEAWVCSCGEFYVPGEVAKEAYSRAFERSTGGPPHTGGPDGSSQSRTAVPSGQAVSGSLAAHFQQLAQQWRSETAHLSNVRKKALHPAYQEIIGMGEPAVPLILAEMKRQPGQWFWALHAITRDDPVAEESRGNLAEMTEAWLAWGRKHGYNV